MCAFVWLFVLPSVFAETPATTTPLLLPSAIVFDPLGNLYVAEAGSHVVLKIDTAGVVTTIAGTGTQGFAGDGGPATSALLDSPAGLALDSAGVLFIADTHNHRVRKIDPATGLITTMAGNGTSGFTGDGRLATSASLDLPTALAIDASGNLFIADTDNHRIRRIAATSGLISTVVGNGIEAFAGDGGLATLASIDSPAGLAVDSTGNLYLADTHNGRVRRVASATGMITTLAGTGAFGFSGEASAATSAKLALPRGLTIDNAGNLYLADSANHRVRRISATGIITTVAGQGTQTFAGDDAPAIAASLDTPRAVTLSAAGLITLADSANQRVRQIDALPAPGPDIHTYAGLGIGIAATTLTLTAPSSTPYGSGSLTANITAATSPTGSITFFDTFAGATSVLATSALAANTASVSTSGLAAGSHSLSASYAGDATHPSATAVAVSLSVTPLTVVATPDPASMLYGQIVPALTGTLTGVLPQDAAKLNGAFSTPALTLSPPGLYPITAMLVGSAAVNYALTTATASLTISQVSTTDSITASATSADLGQPVTFTIRASSRTSGIPTGLVILSDGSSVLASLSLSPAGTATYTASLGLGVHPLSMVYAGDVDFLPGTSPITTIAIGIPSDFTLSSSGSATQTVASGSAASYTFAALFQGNALTSPVNLTVRGLPVGATPSLNPTYLPPGGAVTSFTLAVQTTKAFLQTPKDLFPQIPSSQTPFSLAILIFPGIALACRKKPNRKGQVPRRTLPPSISTISTLSLLATLSLCIGCGDRVNTATSASAAAKIYTITVTGTASTPAGALLQHSVDVTLQVL